VICVRCGLLTEWDDWQVCLLCLDDADEECPPGCGCDWCVLPRPVVDVETRGLT
jgi:hypothetical protein